MYFDIIGDVEEIQTIAVGGKDSRHNADSETVWAWPMA